MQTEVSLAPYELNPGISSDESQTLENLKIQCATTIGKNSLDLFEKMAEEDEPCQADLKTYQECTLKLVSCYFENHPDKVVDIAKRSTNMFLGLLQTLSQEYTKLIKSTNRPQATSLVNCLNRSKKVI